MAATRTLSKTAKLVDLLGGGRTFGRKPRTSNQLQEFLRRGLPYGTFDALRAALGVPADKLAEVVGVAPRTLARRKSAQQLTSIESDRLYRVAHVAVTASETLGSLEKARHWLHEANRALGGGTPISLLDTEIGEQRVLDLLERINYGVYS